MTQQYIVSLDFFDLFFMFHAHAGSFFKQDDVRRMKLNGLNLLFLFCYLFITGTVRSVAFVVEQDTKIDIVYVC